MTNDTLADESLIRRVEYMLDPTASASQRLDRRAHLTNHDLRCILKALRTPPTSTDERKDVLEEAARAMENLCFFTPVEELLGMTKQETSVRTCRAGAAAIRALKPTPNPTIDDHGGEE